MSDDVRQDVEASSLQTQLDYVCTVLDFLDTLSGAVPVVQSLVHSKTSSDVVEAVRFFVRAVNFNVKGTKKSLQGCFSLVFHQEKAVQEECLSAFKHAYLTDGAATATEAQALPPQQVTFRSPSLRPSTLPLPLLFVTCWYRRIHRRYSSLSTHLP